MEEGDADVRGPPREYVKSNEAPRPELGGIGGREDIVGVIEGDCCGRLGRRFDVFTKRLPSEKDWRCVSGGMITSKETFVF